MNCLPVATVVALACGVTVAQRVDVPAAGLSLAAVHGIVHDAAGAPWALGSDYKARIADGRIEFTPALGSRAPVNRTLVFALHSVTRGDQVLHAAHASPRASVDGTTVAFARGGVTERYECRPDGVEQSFVFPTRPAGSGDLVVRGVITTALRPAPGADGGLFFHDGEVGGVNIGAVTGIDARGARCAGSMHFADGMLELRLPAAFVASATYPLVLDPLLGTGLLVSGPVTDDDQPDVAFEETLNVYLVVWRRTFSATDQDIQAQRVTDSGAFFGSVAAITLTPTAEAEPVVAAINSRSQFVVAWQWSPAGFGPWAVRAVSVSTATIGTAVDVSVPGENSTSPAVCGDRSLVGTKALIAWQGSAGVNRRRTADVAGNGAIALGAIHSSTLASTDSLRLPRSRQPAGITLLASNQLVPFVGFERTLEPLDYDGAALAPATIVATTAGYPPADLGCDGDGTDFLVAYNDQTTGRCTAVQWNGAALVLGASATFATTPPAQTAVAWLGERFLVVWQTTSANPFDGDLHALAIKPDCTACSAEFPLPVVSRPNQRTPAIGPRFAGGSAATEALLVWAETNTGAPFASNVVAQRFAAMVGAPPVVLSPAGPGGGSSGIEQPFALGSEDFAFQLAGADPAAVFAVLALSDGSTAPIACGMTFLNPLASYAMLAVNGAARQAFPVPCNPLLLGFTLEYQWLLLGGAVSPCPLVPGLTGSERRQVTLSL